MKWLKKWLEKLAEANEKNFGGVTPPCCGGGNKQNTVLTPPKNKNTSGK